MGCSSTADGTKDYDVIYSKLVPISGNTKYKIEKIDEENILKSPDVKLFNQVGLGENKSISSFLDSQHFTEHTLVYFYLRDKPVIKSVKQSLDYVPDPLLYKVILLSTESIDPKYKTIIEKLTIDTNAKDFIGKTLNLSDYQKTLEITQNPNITKDSLELNETENNEDETEEKNDEVIINEDLTKEIYTLTVAKLKKIPHRKFSPHQPVKKVFLMKDLCPK